MILLPLLITVISKTHIAPVFMELVFLYYMKTSKVTYQKLDSPPSF